MMANSSQIRLALSLLGSLVALLLIAFSQGCQKQYLNAEATHGLSNDPYPTAPGNLASTLRVLIWPDTILDENVASFEKRYGVKLEIVTFANDDEAYQKLISNPKGWDLIMVSQYMADRMHREEMLRPVPKLNPYIYQYIDGTVLNPKADPQMKYFIPYDYAVLGISFNIDHVAGFPRKWGYLNEHKNHPYIYSRLVMTDDMRYAMAAALLYSGLDPTSVDPRDIAIARDLLIVNVKELGLRFSPDSKIRGEMMDGSAMIAITWSGEAAAILKAKPECRFLVPEGKSIMTVDGFSIPKGSRCPETAALFIEFMLHPYNSLLVANTSMYASVNMRTMKYVDRFITNGPSCLIAPPGERIHMRQLEGESLRLYQEAWAEVKKAEIDASKIRPIPLK